MVFNSVLFKKKTGCLFGDKVCIILPYTTVWL